MCAYSPNLKGWFIYKYKLQMTVILYTKADLKKEIRKKKQNNDLKMCIA